MKRYLGVDLHRTQFTVCTRLENGRTYLRQWRMRELKLFAAQLHPDAEIAVEATGNTRLFYDQVVKRVGRVVVVVNPSQFKVLAQVAVLGLDQVACCVDARLASSGPVEADDRYVNGQ